MTGSQLVVQYAGFIAPDSESVFLVDLMQPALLRRIPRLKKIFLKRERSSV